MAARSPDPACTHTNTISLEPDQASCTPDFSYSLVTFTSFSFSSTVCLSHVHNSTIIAEHKVVSSISISPSHDHQLTLRTSIHQVQHTSSIVFPQNRLSSLYFHDYELTPECSFSFRRTSLHDRPRSARSPSELKGKVTLSHSHGCELTD
jgi:hypothetical protein